MTSDSFEDARRMMLDSLRALDASDRALSGAGEKAWDDAMRAYAEDVRSARRHCEALEQLLLERLQGDPRP